MSGDGDFRGMLCDTECQKIEILDVEQTRVS